MKELFPLSGVVAIPQTPFADDGGIDFASLTGGSNGKPITSGDVTTTEGFRWDPPSWAPDSWTSNDWILTTVLAVAVVLVLLHPRVLVLRHRRWVRRHRPARPHVVVEVR